MDSTNQWTRVIVLTPPPPNGKGLNAALKSQFAQRDWFAVEQHDPHLAMAELCLRERAQASRAAWGLQRMERIALVIHQADHWHQHGNQVEQMIAAVAHFLPTASIWQAEGDRLTPLQGANADAVASLKTNHEIAAGFRAPANTAVAMTPKLRMAGEDLKQQQALKVAMEPKPQTFDLSDGDDSVHTELAGKSSLSRQEIDMLLAMDEEPPTFGAKS